MRIAVLIASTFLTGIAADLNAQSPPAPAELPSIALPLALDRVLRDYESAWRRGDAAGLAALFAEDGFVLQGGRPPVRGRAGIEAAYAGQGGGSLRLRALAAATGDTLAYIIGAYGYGDDPGDVGKFTLTLRRGAEGQWLIFSDMDNASRPPPPAAASAAEPPLTQLFDVVVSAAHTEAFLRSRPGYTGGPVWLDTASVRAAATQLGAPAPEIDGLVASRARTTAVTVRSDAIDCDLWAKRCEVRSNGHLVVIDSVARTASGMEVTATGSFTDRRPSGSSAIGHAQIRYTLQPVGGRWMIVAKRTIRQT